MNTHARGHASEPAEEFLPTTPSLAGGKLEDVTIGKQTEPPRSGSLARWLALFLCLAARTLAGVSGDVETVGVRVAFKVLHDGGREKGGPTTSGKLTVKVADDLTAQLIDADSGKEIGPALGHSRRRTGMRITAWAFSPDGKPLATASGHGRPDGIDTVGEVRVWDVATGKQVAAATDAEHDLGWVHSVAFANDNKTVMIDCKRLSGR